MPESRHDRRVRHVHRTKLYLYACGFTIVLAAIVALIAANTRTVTVSWVFGSSRQLLVWVVLATALLSWVLGVMTSVLFRHRTRARRVYTPDVRPAAVDVRS